VARPETGSACAAELHRAFGGTIKGYQCFAIAQSSVRCDWRSPSQCTSKSGVIYTQDPTLYYEDLRAECHESDASCPLCEKYLDTCADSTYPFGEKNCGSVGTRSCGVELEDECKLASNYSEGTLSWNCYCSQTVVSSDCGLTKPKLQLSGGACD
jgi:hypothetical protein